MRPRSPRPNASGLDQENSTEALLVRLVALLETALDIFVGHHPGLLRSRQRSFGRVTGSAFPDPRMVCQRSLNFRLAERVGGSTCCLHEVGHAGVWAILDEYADPAVNVKAWTQQPLGRLRTQLIELLERQQCRACGCRCI